MSGHFATLLRGTVEALLPDHDVHVTDWTDAARCRSRSATSISTTMSTTSWSSAAISGRTSMSSRLPAVGAGHGGGGPDGRRQGPAPAQIDHLMGGPIDTARQPDHAQ